MRTVLSLLGAMIAAALLAGVPKAAFACTNVIPCEVEKGFYLVSPPPGWDGKSPIGAFVFFHGYRDNAAGSLERTELVRAAHDLGYLFVAMEGTGMTWSYPGSPGTFRDEFAYTRSVLADLSKRFPIDAGNLVASGFSQGGSMTWYLACGMGDQFLAFLPVAGAFWQPQPTTCETPANIYHVHGTTDGVVPMTGRIIGRWWRQGDVMASIGTALAAARCDARPSRLEPRQELACQFHDGCGDGRKVALCLHGGGHTIEASWLRNAADWLQALRGRPVGSDQVATARK